MIYKLNPIVEIIQSPVLLCIDSPSDPKHHFSSGKELADAYFEKKYVIDSISAMGNAVVVTVSENTTNVPTNWIGEEMVSFF